MATWSAVSQVMMLFQANSATARFAMLWKKISRRTPIGVDPWMHWDASNSTLKISSDSVQIHNEIM